MSPGIAALVLAAALASTAGVAEASARPHGDWPDDPMARADALRAGGLAAGLTSYDSAARALLLGPEPERVRAEMAVRLAPDLPAAQAALARARLREGDLPAAAASLARALAALPRHPESQLWLRAQLGVAAAAGCALGAAWFLALCGLGALRRAAHDLGDLLSLDTPPAARALLVAGLVLLPAVLGGGALGALGALGAAALAYAPGRQRRAVAASLGVLALAVGPLIDVAARALVAPSGTAVGAALAERRAALTAPERARLERALPASPGAGHALAVNARRRGDLAKADRLYRALLATAPDAVAANNAGNVRVLLGDPEGAVALYHIAERWLDSPIVQFNLSQAYGRSIALLEQERALERAQALDADLVGRLTDLDGESRGLLLVDLPPAASVSGEVDPAAAGAVAASLRSKALPGGAGATGAALWLLAPLAVALPALRARRTVICAGCGARMCPRCDPAGEDDRCARCRERRFTSEGAEAEGPWARVQVAVRQADAWLAPLRARPVAGLLLCLAAACGAALVATTGFVPDPLAAGAAATFTTRGAGLLLLAGSALVALRVVRAGSR